MSNAKDAINSTTVPPKVNKFEKDDASPPGHDHRKLMFCTQCDRVVRISPAGVEVSVPDHTSEDHFRVFVIQWKTKEQREKYVGEFLRFTATLVSTVQKENEIAAASAAAAAPAATGNQ